MLLTYVSNCMKPSRHKHSPHLQMKGRGDTMIVKLMPFHLNQATWLLAKANSCKRRRNVKDQWEEELYKVECWIAEGVPSYLMKNQQTRCSWVLHCNWFFSHYPCNGSSFMFRHASWADKVCHHCPEGAYLESEWEWGSTTKCELSAAGSAPDRWDSSRVHQ